VMPDAPMITATSAAIIHFTLPFSFFMPLTPWKLSCQSARRRTARQSPARSAATTACIRRHRAVL